jgi:integrase
MSDRVPVYRIKKVGHHRYGCVSLPTGTGTRKDVLLGRHSKQAKAEYARVIAEWEAKDRRGVPGETDHKTPDLSIAELLAAYWKHAEGYYRDKDGNPTGEINDLRFALKPVREMFGDLDASKFTPLCLKSIRQRMITQPITTRIKTVDPKTSKRAWTHKVLKVGLCRKLINARVHRIRRVFRWAVSEGLVGADVYVALQTLEPLKAGRSAARESQPVKAVSEALVWDTLPFLSATIADMVRILAFTGMRCGELCLMRGCDLDTSASVWLYRPGRHKTEHHGHERVIAIGPKAQHILRAYLRTDTQAPLFSPVESMKQFRAKRRQERKSKVQPSQVDRRKAHPKRRPGAKYSAKTLSHAIGRACRKHGLPSWHAHQLRHLHASLARKQFDLDHAQASLGHHSPQVSVRYAELAEEKARAVAARIG